MNIAARTGQELNITDISNSIEINNNTADNWLSILKNKSKCKKVLHF